MAFETPGFSWTRVAGEDLSDSQYCGVDLNTDSEAILPTAGGRIIGVTRNKEVEGGSIAIVSDGIVFGKIGVTGATPSDNMAIDDDGTFVQAVSGDVAVARCITGGAAGTLGTFLLQIAAGNIVTTS